MKEQEKLSSDLFEPAFRENINSIDFNRPSLTFYQDVWCRLKNNKGAVFGLAMIMMIILLALVGPYFNPYGIDDQEITRTNLPPKVPVLENISFLGLDGVDIRGVDQYEKKSVSEYFWFGTDNLGRDQWTRVWQGTRVSLYIAFLAAAIDLLIGVVYGGVSAFYGGKIDNILQRVIDV